MIIYRVAYKGIGKGPYRSGFDISIKLSDKHYGKKWPTPTIYEYDDISFMGKVYFGFESIDQILDWFSDDELIELYDTGFKISVFDVPDKFVKICRKQVMFILTESSLVKVLSFDEFVELIQGKENVDTKRN